MVEIHEKYQLRRVINACGKMTSLCGAAVLPEIAAVVHDGLQHFFELDDLQRAAGEVITQATGSESGCVTACTAAGITLSVAACMTGNDLARVLQLPDARGMKNRVLIQQGHCVNFGAPITQAIRLAGARVTEVGEINRCTAIQLRHELEQDDVAAVVAVESHHTVRHGWVRLPELVPLAHEYGVPVILDGAAQDQRLAELVEIGCDLVIASAHKFLCSTTAGIVAGRKDLVDAVYLQNRGIGRGMKAGKEAILGVMAALEYRMQQPMEDWTAEQDRKVQLILDLLSGAPGLVLSVDPDPNGCPFSRARLTPDPDQGGLTARQLSDALGEGDPTVVARAHHADEGYIYLDAIEMSDADIHLACEKVRAILAGS
ncbi:MAG: aminotransferase class V-fold PLP-dependent enzyme [Planctomycetota bacterium]|nr:aminotransferase class V-fold PLP-dependent enzyme [Planctomycetota bacterium]